ncbi:MAG: hypothetical protein LRS49_00665 [Desulfurococcales archaeon]|nr:hypothetical protein [Desulfurococcales archaeon]
MRLPAGVRGVALVWLGALVAAGAMFALAYSRVGGVFHLGANLAAPSTVQNGTFTYQDSLALHARLPIRVRVEAVILPSTLGLSNATVDVSLNGARVATLTPGGSYVAVLGSGDRLEVTSEVVRHHTSEARVVVAEVEVEPAPRGLALAAAMVAALAALALGVARGGRL